MKQQIMKHAMGSRMNQWSENYWGPTRGFGDLGRLFSGNCGELGHVLRDLGSKHKILGFSGAGN